MLYTTGQTDLFREMESLITKQTSWKDPVDLRGVSGVALGASQNAGPVVHELTPFVSSRSRSIIRNGYSSKILSVSGANQSIGVTRRWLSLRPFPTMGI